MPSALAPVAVAARKPATRPRARWVSPMMRRILLVNALPLGLLVATLLYLNEFQNSLLEAEVSALREQARIYAGALGQSAVAPAPPAAGARGAPHTHGRARPPHQGSAPDLVLAPDLARPLLLRLTEPSPSSQARLFAPDGQLIADSRADQISAGDNAGAADGQNAGPPLLVAGSGLLDRLEHAYDRLLSILPETRLPVATLGANANPDDQPDVRQQLHLGDQDSSETPPFIRRTADRRLLVTVAEPVEHDGHTVGIIQLTREARDVDRSLFEVRSSILMLFLIALALTVLLSWYLSLTIARPLLRLAASAHVMREGIGRSGSVPARLCRRRDEIGELALALDESARALWTRMDAIERFAADVSHEIKNPLSSIRSAIETLLRIEDLNQQRRLLAIIGEDVRRLDRLITDISDASRIDAELSRARSEPVELTPILSVLAEIHQATRKPDGPVLEVKAASQPLVVLAIEDRLVQVLRNLIGNAVSFSPAHGIITLEVSATDSWVEIAVGDQGPGIPQGKLDSIFDRFYSERPAGEHFGQHSGLGLSISRQIVEALRGRITAENRLDAQGGVCGARFVVRLPQAPAD
ncbi:stimulus-sensing domain-containing protein [Lichenicoccus sp.]|uniref:stimulus-sensing domain-containing protein n=1 Tax=Lichenicoccus sp. TaxID=2781899 RepID=UPI003D122BBC